MPVPRFGSVKAIILLLASCLSWHCHPSPSTSPQPPQAQEVEVAPPASEDIATPDPCAEVEVDANYFQWPTDGWQTTCPEQQNIDSAQLQLAKDYALYRNRHTQAVVIIRNGAIVAEWYGEDKGPSDHVTSWSVAKSFLSALVGIAIERGELSSVDEPLANYIPEFQGTDKEAITFRHALQMRSGLRPNSPNNIYWQLDQHAYSLFREFEEPPGGTWAYQNEDSMLISQALEVAVGQPFVEYANEVLFEPIGMSGIWWTDSREHPLGYCCLDATARDFARFGLLFARSGEWNEKQVVPASWVQESTRPVNEDVPYALHWWTFDEGRVFAAIGALYQSIWVFPEYDLVVVRNGKYTKRGQPGVYRLDNGNYHDTPKPTNWDDGDFLTLVFDALNDYDPEE